MQERGDRPLLVEGPAGGEVGHVDAVERRVGRLAHQRLDRGDHFGVGRLTQQREQRLGFGKLDFVHGTSLRENGCAERGSRATHEFVSKVQRFANLGSTCARRWGL